MNDPLEYSYISFPLVTSECEHGKDSYKINKTARKIFDLNYKLLCGSMGGKNTVVWDNPPMWAHYGSKNSGVILRFDYEELMKSISGSGYEIIKTGKIDYIKSGKIPGGLIDLDSVKNENDLIGIKTQLDAFVKNRYFQKHKLWSYEKEYRVLGYSSNSNFDYVPFGASLREIIIGEKVDHNQIKPVFGKIKNFNVKLYKVMNYGVRLNYSRFKINLDEI
jgi:hypothetical protein